MHNKTAWSLLSASQPLPLDSRFHGNDRPCCVIPTQTGIQAYETKRSFVSGSKLNTSQPHFALTLGQKCPTHKQ